MESMQTAQINCIVHNPDTIHEAHDNKIDDRNISLLSSEA